MLGMPEYNWASKLEEMTKVFVAFNGFCVKHKINTTNVSQSDFVYFKLGSYYPMDVIIADTDSSPFYILNSKTLTGRDILHEQGVQKYYDISFREIQRNEESGECTNYGESSEFPTYADCVAREHELMFQPLLGCRVPWLSNPGNPANCRGKVQLTENLVTEFSEKFATFWHNVKILGNAHSNACLKPCTELQADCTLTTLDHNGDDLININFNKQVRVTKYQKAYGIFELIVEVGSSLGLWIGLSALGVYDIFLLAGTAVKERFM